MTVNNVNSILPETISGTEFDSCLWSAVTRQCFNEYVWSHGHFRGMSRQIVELCTSQYLCVCVRAGEKERERKTEGVCVCVHWRVLSEGGGGRR